MLFRLRSKEQKEEWEGEVHDQKRLVWWLFFPFVYDLAPTASLGPCWPRSPLLLLEARELKYLGVRLGKRRGQERKKRIGKRSKSMEKQEVEGGMRLMSKDSFGVQERVHSKREWPRVDS